MWNLQQKEIKSEDAYGKEHEKLHPGIGPEGLVLGGCFRCGCFVGSGMIDQKPLGVWEKHHNRSGNQW